MLQELSVAIFLFVVLGLSGLAFLLYRSAVRRYDQSVIERYEDSKREERRQGQAAAVLEPPAEIEGVPADVYAAECADVLAQLAQRRRELRRPRPRSYAGSD